MISPFEVIKKKDLSLELQFPQAMKIYNIFLLNLLQKTSIDPLISEVNKLVLPVIIYNKEEWKVENIFDTRNY